MISKVLAQITVRNIHDLYAVEAGRLVASGVRTVFASEALASARTTMFAMPARFIRQLGLEKLCTTTIRTANGIRDFAVYGTVELTVQGRDCRVDVAELPDDCPILIGQVPLELLDFVVDPQGQRLMGNPDHGGKHMIDMFAMS